MPVLMTIATVTYLFSGKSGGAPSLLEPESLRKAIEKLPEGSSRDNAVKVVEEIDKLATNYEMATNKAIKVYTVDVEKKKSSYDDLLKDLQPADEQRAKTLTDLIEIRERLVEALSPEEWDVVFG